MDRSKIKITLHRLLDSDIFTYIRITPGKILH